MSLRYQLFICLVLVFIVIISQASFDCRPQLHVLSTLHYDTASITTTT